jgi:hypothetical protein
MNVAISTAGLKNLNNSPTTPADLRQRDLFLPALL